MKSKWIFLIPVIVGFIACTDDEPDKSAPIRMCVKYLFSKRLG